MVNRRAAAGRREKSSGAQPAPAAWTGEIDLPDAGLVARALRLNMLVTRALEEITGEFGLAPADYIVLGTLRRSPGRRSAPTRLCEILWRSTGGMTLTLDRLEAAGWVRRQPDPDDRRRVVVVLTPAGLSISTRVSQALRRWEETLGLGSGPRQQTLRVLDELLAVVERSTARP
jgi:DNA-binding MarR family transcriptional regulator